MVFANLWPLDRQCAWDFPEAVTCLVGENRAGGTIGALRDALMDWSEHRVGLAACLTRIC
jgi:hypothetical protein